MKLQVNTSGAWKDVMEFEARNVDAVQSLVSGMYHISNHRSRFRITTNGIHPSSMMDHEGVWAVVKSRETHDGQE